MKSPLNKSIAKGALVGIVFAGFSTMAEELSVLRIKSVQ